VFGDTIVSVGDKSSGGHGSFSISQHGPVLLRKMDEVIQGSGIFSDFSNPCTALLGGPVDASNCCWPLDIGREFSQSCQEKRGDVSRGVSAGPHCLECVSCMIIQETNQGIHSLIISLLLKGHSFVLWVTNSNPKHIVTYYVY
jgi:hypothetical protein